MISEALMNTGTWLLALAAIPQLIKLWENRHNLTGYSCIGSFILFCGLSLITISFALMEMWWSVLAQIIPLVLWLLATKFTYERDTQ